MTPSINCWAIISACQWLTALSTSPVSLCPYDYDACIWSILLHKMLSWFWHRISIRRGGANGKFASSIRFVWSLRRNTAPACMKQQILFCHMLNFTLKKYTMTSLNYFADIVQADEWAQVCWTITGHGLIFTEWPRRLLMSLMEVYVAQYVLSIQWNAWRRARDVFPSYSFDVKSKTVHISRRHWIKLTPKRVSKFSMLCQKINLEIWKTSAIWKTWCVKACF